MRLQESFFPYVFTTKTSLILLFFISCNQSNQEQVVRESEGQVDNLIEPTKTTVSTVDVPIYYLNEKNIPIQNDLYHTSFDSCIDFLVSNQKVSCEGNYESIKSVVFENKHSALSN